MIDPRTIPDDMLWLEPVGNGRVLIKKAFLIVGLAAAVLIATIMPMMGQTFNSGDEKGRMNVDLLMGGFAFSMVFGISMAVVLLAIKARDRHYYRFGYDKLPAEVAEYLMPNRKEYGIFIRQIWIGVALVGAIFAISFPIGFIAETYGFSTQIVSIIVGAVFGGIAVSLDNSSGMNGKYKKYYPVQCPYCTNLIKVRYIYFDDLEKGERDAQGEPVYHCPACGKASGIPDFEKEYRKYDRYRQKYLMDPSAWDW